MPRISLDDVATCERCATEPVGRGMCSSHYPVWRRANLGAPCPVCVLAGGSRRAAVRGLCGGHDMVARRAAEELDGFRARVSGKSPSCGAAPCGQERETGSLFCGASCRAAASEWPAGVVKRQCASCLTSFSARRRDARFCSTNCRSFNQHVRKKFGIPLEEYVARVRAPDVRCAICGSDGDGRWLCLDHDHETGQLRGALCDPCNRGLGRARDDTGRLRGLIGYLTSTLPLPDSTVFSVPPVGTCRMCLTTCADSDRKTRGYCSQVCSGRARDCRRYGLTPEQFHWLVGLTGSSCTVCDAALSVGAEHHDDRVMVDHCHDSGQVRGILCNYCNLAVSCFQDDTARLEGAIDYLDAYAAAAV